MEAAMVVTLWLDLVTHAPRQNPTVNPAVFEPGLVRLSPAPATGVSRVMVSSHSLLNLHIGSVSDSFNDYLGTRLALAADCNLLDSIPKVDGFFSMYLRESDDIINIYYPRPVADLSRLTDFLNVSHVTVPGKLFDWEFRTNFLPFVTGGQHPLFLNQAQTLQSLCARDFDPRKMVCLPVDARSVVSADFNDAQVRNKGFSAQRGEVEVASQRASLVVVSQAYCHPWRAYVDDRPARIWRANYAFQALEVPAGHHRVTLAYQDDVFYAGGIISFLALAGCGVLARPARSPGRISAERFPLPDGNRQ